MLGGEVGTGSERASLVAREPRSDCSCACSAFGISGDGESFGCSFSTGFRGSIVTEANKRRKRRCEQMSNHFKESNSFFPVVVVVLRGV